MATALTKTTISRAGVDLVATATAADATGNNWTNTGGEFLFIKNGGGSSITLTLAVGPGAVVDGQTPTSKTVTVAAGKEFLVGPFPVTIYSDVNNLMNITYSGVTSVTVAVLSYTPNT